MTNVPHKTHLIRRFSRVNIISSTTVVMVFRNALIWFMKFCTVSSRGFSGYSCIVTWSARSWWPFALEILESTRIIVKCLVSLALNAKFWQYNYHIECSVFSPCSSLQQKLHEWKPKTNKLNKLMLTLWRASETTQSFWVFKGFFTNPKGASIIDAEICSTWKAFSSHSILTHRNLRWQKVSSHF